MGARILVIDDSQTLRKVVSAILSRHGFSIVAVPDGRAALDTLDDDEQRFDLVLLDFVMPRMNGYQFCRELRGRARVRDLPVVLMSAKAERIRDQFLNQTGAIDAITKPFDARALVAVVEGALERTADGRAPRAPNATDMPPDDVSFDRPHESASPSSRAGLGELHGSRARAEMVRVMLSVFGRALLDAVPGCSVDAPRIERALATALTDDAMVQLLDRMRWLTLAPNSSDVLYGDISSMPIGEILQVLQMQRQTGILDVSNGSVSVSISLRDGLVDLAQSRNASPEFRLGRYLLERERLTLVQLLEAVDEATKSVRLMGDVLLTKRLVSQEDLRDALVRQTSEMIYEVLRWQKGWFLLHRDARPREAQSAQLGLSVAAIVMEGFRRVDEWRLIEETIDFDDVLCRDEIAIGTIPFGKLTEQELATLKEIDGTRSVREVIAASHQSSFDICKAFYRFLQSRLVRRRSE
ncbi:MAG: response regulator [Polyangiaceae bacterium]|jgi:DNA-binding response OmpR family regulator|nr:response regulator [Polyangiaceae bacterium]